ncbi:MAG: LPD29 domain-containing protein [Bacilli bacterium]
MSAYMVSDETINTIVNYLFSHKKHFAHYMQPYTDPKRFGLRMFVLNKQGVDQRYGIGGAKKFREFDYSYVSMNPQSTSSTKDSLSELLYQCAEGNVINKRFYKLLENIFNTMNTLAQEEKQQEIINKPVARYIDAAEVAKMVRSELKLAFPNIKFSVKTSRYSGGSSIRVSWTDGPTKKEVDSIVGYMHGASFDGMIDLQSYHDSTDPKTGELIHYGNNYIFCERDYSKEALILFWDKTCQEYGINPNKAVLQNKNDYYWYKFDNDSQAYPNDYQTLFNTTAYNTSLITQNTNTTKVKFGEYKGHKTITLPLGDKDFTFGVNKAQAILTYIQEIEQFVKDQK